MTKVMLDTNVFIYALDATFSFHSQSLSVITDPQLQLFTTTKNISEYFAVTSKLRVPPKIVWNFYADIRQNVTIIYPSDNSLKRFEKMLKNTNQRAIAFLILK